MIHRAASRPRWLRLVLAWTCLATGGPAFAQTQPEIEHVRELIKGGKYREAEAAARPLATGDGPVAVDALDALVESLWRLGRHQEPETVTLARRAVALREAEGASGEDRLGNSVLSLAIVLSHRGEYAEARPAFERALALRERALGPQHKDVGRILNAYGVMLTNVGDFDASRRTLDRALAISEVANGPDTMPTAVVLTNIANVLYGTGDLTSALTTYERVLEIAQRTFPDGHPYVSTALSNVAGVLELMGDSATARPFYERALALNEKIFGAESQAVASDLQNIGFNLMSLGDHAGARKAILRSLAFREKNESKAVYGYTLAALGSLLLRTGEYPQAREALEKGLPLIEGGLGPGHPRVGEVVALYGDLLAATNDTQGALAAYERSIGIFQEAFGPLHRKVSDTRRSLAWVLLARGDTARAARESAQAEEDRRTFLRETIRVLPERQALALAKDYPSALDVQLAAATQPAAALRLDELLDGVIRSRALVLDEMASRHRVAFGGDATTQSLAGRYVEARRRLANLLVRSASNDSPDETLNAALAAARRASELAERDLAAASAEFRAEQGRARAGLAEVKAALPPDSVLVSLVRHAARGGMDPPYAYSALVLRADAARPALLALGAAPAIDDVVQKWRARLLAEGTAGIRSRRSETLLRREGAALRAALWDPLLPHLSGAARVFVVMDGALHLVNLAALPLDARRYLVEEPYEIHTLSAERDLLGGSGGPGTGLLAVGGPAYDRQPPPSTMRTAAFRSAPSECKPFATVRFTPLPGSLAESRQVARTWPAGSSTVLAGSDASEAAFKAAAPGKRVLHLATHGFVLGGSCAEGGSTRGGAPAVSSLTLSGLAFAGANLRASTAPGHEDGILTGEEAAALDLRGVEWTVLSACDTGLGERAAGEGVLGLRRAFQVAGARTVITSLWPVEDESSRAWMAALYRRRHVDGLSTSASVRQASLDRLRALRAAGGSAHPYYWAAFVAAGDWR
jgi:CHAT domain-containing protein/tetratricopeptide (TPR) repeat protein